ncbi:SDR family NAD(P)-dependent oxidoreductase [Arsenicicoccus sp. MKL-02]|uniref:SDR family NAD(P)-dependent oxidoreductase n=1 Tax=Arsenicicoccus cauae TaxID=2663847 RepID=A0A6I3IAM6_9MICO|nr:oxidoreductase [Arsenicicoccus cauae]MTB73254.1 SDR family NAD(P)-dependent oxidoreductase [Arsenicicoccus cauae]
MTDSTTPIGPVSLVTGASSGIGEAIARRLQTLGHTVYGAARRIDRLEALAADGIEPIAMDVTDEASLQAGVETILSRSGRFDVLVNNAGYGSYGAIEDVDPAEARRQFDVNVFGAMRLTQLVLPHMREQRSGTIVNISSMGGRIHSPMAGWYHGTKFAMEALSDALRMEVAQFGIDVVVIQPGGIATEWADIAADHLDETSGSGPYARLSAAMSATLRKSHDRDSSPDVVAKAVARAVSTDRPRTRYAIGLGAKPLITARRVLPDRAFDALVSRAMGLPRGSGPGR